MHERTEDAGSTSLFRRTLYLRIHRRTEPPPVATTGRMKPLEHGHRRRIRRGHRTLQGDYGPDGAADAASESAGAAGPFRDYGPDAGSSGRTKPEYTAARGRQHGHATFGRLRTDASVRCTGLGEPSHLPTSDRPRRPGRAGHRRCSIMAITFVSRGHHIEPVGTRGFEWDTLQRQLRQK